jgi:hypothetical protein
VTVVLKEELVSSNAITSMEVCCRVLGMFVVTGRLAAVFAAATDANKEGLIVVQALS